MNPFSKEEKLFSILTPVYGKYYEDIPKYFTSLNEQEYKKMEIIIVFDGPNSGGVKAVKKEMKKYPKLDVKYEVIEHKGCTGARNHAQTLAKGDYYAFVNIDCYLYPEALRIWANTFEEHPECNRVWGLYDIIQPDGTMSYPIGQAPVYPDGRVWYKGFKWSPFADACFPIRATSYIPWDEDCKSLNDWELSVRMLKRDNFEGKDWQYHHQSFFAAEAPREGGLSNDSHENWIARRKYLQEKNGIYSSDICVASLGAPNHAFHVVDKLGCDFLPMPSFKPHEYKMVYLLGFYTKEDPSKGYAMVTSTHMDIFRRNKGKNVIHWIGTDILQLRTNCNFEKIKAFKQWIKENKIINLTECEQTYKELKEVGIDSKIIPIPPKSLNKVIPLPEKFTVGIYDPDSEIYNRELMGEVIDAMPDVQFYLFGQSERKGQKGKNWEHLGYIDFDEWMDKFSCNLRITMHDGLPLTPIQFITAGRSVVTNFPLKHTIKVDSTRESVIQGVREAQKSGLNEKGAKYWTKELDFKKYKKSVRGLL